MEPVALAVDKLKSFAKSSQDFVHTLTHRPENSSSRNPDDDAKVKRAFQTLLTYVGNVVRNPAEEKFRKIRLSNQSFHERVGALQGGIEFLELCGFEKIEGGEFLLIPRDKVDMAVLNSAGAELDSAIKNPFFGVL